MVPLSFVPINCPNHLPLGMPKTVLQLRNSVLNGTFSRFSQSTVKGNFFFQFITEMVVDKLEETSLQ